MYILGTKRLSNIRYVNLPEWNEYNGSYFIFQEKEIAWYSSNRSWLWVSISMNMNFLYEWAYRCIYNCIEFTVIRRQLVLWNHI